MNVTRSRTRDEIAKLRERAYLAAWPAAQQLEAQQDKLDGNPAKWERMRADFSAIRALYPYPDTTPNEET
ncbi:hypothetical protein [Azospirillum sp. B510]|uniref:hypothetical protein n=1 Tax=Azospirillum sp. (strain B510) TaxID=137722 RepID=UPI0003010EBD|nr:hypothetical protein [Azospirillum sp. B510]